MVPAGGPVRYVLEVIGGTARKLGIEPGDKVDRRAVALKSRFSALLRVAGAREACIEIPAVHRSAWRGIAQPGSASALGAEGRRFKSCCPDHSSICDDIVTALT